MSENNFENEQSKKKWYEKTWVIVLALILFCPIGLILLWICPRGSIRFKGAVTVVVVFLVTFSYMENYFSEWEFSPGVAGKQNNQKATFTERYIYADKERNCLCIVSKDDISEVLDVVKKEDIIAFSELLSSGKVFVIEELTKVRCSDVEVRRGMVLVNILEGEYKDKWAYTFSIRVR